MQPSEPKMTGYEDVQKEAAEEVERLRKVIEQKWKDLDILPPEAGEERLRRKSEIHDLISQLHSNVKFRDWLKFS